MEEEKKQNAATRAKNKYNAKTYEIIKLNVKKGEKEIIINHAKSLNLSTNAYIINLIKNDINGGKENE